jgi:hypothetical protein
MSKFRITLVVVVVVLEKTCEVDSDMLEHRFN